MSNRPCSKRACTLTWSVLECVFFAGVVLGWSWLMVVFRSDKYFVDLCNITDLDLGPGELLKGIYQTTTKAPVRRKPCRKPNRRQRDVTEDVQVYSAYYTNLKHASTVAVYDVTTVAANEEAENSTRKDFIGCWEQNEQLRVLFALVVIIRDVLVFPIGIFFDKYGTTRTRLLTVLVFAVGTLMMTFTGAAFPWLIVPAMSLTGVAGTAVLLTNLQIANLFGRRRHTVMSAYAGASVSSALITFLMKLSHFIGVNIQTSFMFLTIGIVPMLVSTIAFLPKTKIPWPLPLDYGKRRNQSLDETMLRKQRAWQRRMSEAGISRFRRPQPQFSPVLVQSLYIWSVVWYGVHHLQTAMFESRFIDLTNPDIDEGVDYEQLYGSVQIFAVVLSPVAGLWIDKYRRRELGVPAGTQQMQNILPVMFTTSALSVFELVASMVTDQLAARIASFFFNLLHRVFLLTTTCAFLMHVHFPQQHFGKLFGVMTAVSSIIGAFQFPMRNFLIKKYTDTLQVNILLLCLSVVSMGHPLNVWYQCRRRLIRDPSRHEDRQRREVSTTHLTSHQDVDDTRIPEGNGEVMESMPELLPREIPDTNGDIVVVYDGSDRHAEEVNDTHI
ncbi:equilibrative nucleobase transporter 1-like [Haliotis rufescens]|uniref:equilibrative nucleobase transporter 1-like n=1 Tax=Haliotis rufescens TaxID=6454 RepID=UPI00201EAA81|nr:equilibrative nucleobase transporter 1-like [Haliotis rufescens]